MNTYLDVSKEQLAKIFTEDFGSPFFLCNLLKFKPLVESSGLSGEAHYKKYMEEVSVYLEIVDLKIVYFGKLLDQLIGPLYKEWDAVLIVEYGSKEDFLKLLTLENYPIEKRRESLIDSRLILSEKI